MLSPENYIRKKSRTLPIYECTINSDWEESLIAQISIASQHTTGNVTACFYLVDLLCLRVKDSDFMFNAPMHAYREHIENVGTKLDISKIDYDLAHNIVFAGVDFATNMGLNPIKNLTQLLSFS